jgi:hypothetical protein
MGRTVAVELTDEEFWLFEREAEANGRTPEEVIAITVRHHAHSLALMASPSALEAEPVQVSGPITAGEVDQIFRVMAERISAKTGRSPDEIVADMCWHITAKRPSFLTEEEAQAAQERFTAFFGSVDSGDPHSADNDRNDADLAREYGRGLKWDE